MNRYDIWVAVLLVALAAPARGEAPQATAPLSLQSCLQRGLRHYPTLKEQAHGLQAARARRQAALYEGVLPTVSAGYGVTAGALSTGGELHNQVTTAVSQPSFWGSQIRVETQWTPDAAGTLGYRVQVVQPLLQGLWCSESKLRHDDSVLSLRQQALQLRAEKHRLRYLIAAAYLDLVLAHEERALLRKSQMSIARLDDAVSAFIEARIVPRSDAVPIKQQLTQNQTQLARQRQKIALHENQLRELIGLAPRAYHDPHELAVALRPAELRYRSRARRFPGSLTLKISDLALERAQLEQHGALWASLPQLEASLSVDQPQYGYDALGRQVANNDRVWAGMVTLRLDAMLLSRIKHHRATRSRALAQAEQTRLQRLQERRNWMRIKNAIQSSGAVAALLEQEARLARQKADNERERYRVGKSNIFVLLSYINESYAVIHRGLTNRLETYKLMQELRWVEGQ